MKKAEKRRPKWTSSYLNQRNARVKFGEISKNLVRLKEGVLQGSAMALTFLRCTVQTLTIYIPCTKCKRLLM